jgi:hypothetical protein
MVVQSTSAKAAEEKRHAGKINKKNSFIFIGLTSRHEKQICLRTGVALNYETNEILKEIRR